MKVNSSDTSLQAQIKRLEDEKQKIIKNHQKEIDHIKNNNSKQIQQIRENNDEDVYVARTRAQSELNDTLKTAEERLQKHKNEIHSESLRLEEQRNKLEETNRSKLKDITALQGNREAASIERARDNASSIERKTTDILDKARTQHDNEVGQFRTRAQIEKIQVQNQNELDMKRINNEFKTMKRAEFLKQKQSLQDLVQTHEREFQKMDLQEKTKLTKQEALYKKKIEMQKALFEQRLKEKQQAYDNKYNAMMAQNDQLLRRVKGAFDQELKSLAKEHSALKKTINSRGQDPFYTAKTLEPMVEDKINGYEISLEVPEWEQEYVQLNSDNRTIEVSLTRSFHATTESDDGTVNSSKKSEVFHKAISVADIVDPNKLTRKYENGVLTFFLKKA